MGSVDLVTLDCGGCLRRPVSVYLPAYPGFDSIAKIEYCTLAQLFYKLTFRPSGQQLHPAKGEAPSLFVLYIRVCAAMSALHICHTSQPLGDGSPPQTLNSESPERPRQSEIPFQVSESRVSNCNAQIWNTSLKDYTVTTTGFDNAAWRALIPTSHLPQVIVVTRTYVLGIPIPPTVTAICRTTHH